MNVTAESIAAADFQPLNELAIGKRVRVMKIQGGKILSRRLMSLGIRVGSELEILHFRSRGVVIASDGNRVALGAGVAEKLLVELLDAE